MRESGDGIARALRAYVLVLIFLAHSAVAQLSQPPESIALQPAPSSLQVALITFGPGEEVWERFGHNAILIDDHDAGTSRLYNYGIFDFAQKNFYSNFARGHMIYRMAIDDPAEQLPYYAEEGRWTVRQDLNLSPAQAEQLREYLDTNALPQNAEYRYEYFTMNCSTRVRDALDAALGGALRAQTIAPSRGFTYRMDALRLMRPDVLVMLGIDAGLGPFADQRLSYWSESFVPMELMRHVRDLHVRDASGNDVALVAHEAQLSPSRIAEPLQFPPFWVWQALAAGVASALALLGLALARRHLLARAVFSLAASALSLALGLGGLVLLGLWLLTDHISAWRNENLFLFNPLCLLLLPCWLTSVRARWRPSAFAHRVALAIALIAGFSFFAKVLPAFAQDNRFWIALLLPMHLALAISLTRARALR